MLELKIPYKNPKPILITGLPRSGTKFIATKLGFAHEDQFRLQPIPDPGDMYSEASFFAVAVLPHIERATIIHQVRNPLHVIRSLMGIRWWQEPRNPENKELNGRHDRINDWVRDAIGVPVTTDEMEKTCYFVEHWSKRAAEFADYRWRIEDWTGEPINGRSRDESITWADVTPEVRRLARQWGYVDASGNLLE